MIIACHHARSSQPDSGSPSRVPWSCGEPSFDQDVDLDDLLSPETPLDPTPGLGNSYAWSLRKDRISRLQAKFVTDRERLRCLEEFVCEAQASYGGARNNACGEPTQLCKYLLSRTDSLKAEYDRTEDMLTCEMLEAVNADRSGDTRPTLDLHFQRCAVLKKVLQVACEVVAVAGGKELDVITGWGRHSEEGTCDLKLTALKVLAELAVKCKVADGNPGRVEVKLEGWLPASAGGKQGTCDNPCPRLEQVMRKLLTAPHRSVLFNGMGCRGT